MRFLNRLGISLMLVAIFLSVVPKTAGPGPGSMSQEVLAWLAIAIFGLGLFLWQGIWREEDR